MNNSALNFMAAAAVFLTTMAPVSADELGEKYSTAIFPFAERGSNVSNYGARISNDLTDSLFHSQDVVVVNRDDLKAELDAAELELSDMISLAQATEIGRITGTQIVITGAIVEAGDSIIIISRIISTRTSRVFLETIRGSKEDVESLMLDMVARMADVIRYHAFKLAS